MSPVEMKITGFWKDTVQWLKKLAKDEMLDPLDKYGQMGVNALADATPKETGLTAASWDYKITRTKDFASITWFNTNLVGGSSLAIMLQYGHGTGTGGWVEGEDYINPPMDPIFEEIKLAVLKEVAR